MKSIFIGGSRTGTNFGKLPQDVNNRLDTIIEKGYNIFIGDANGVDKSVQDYFASKHYNKVTVFVSGNEQIRNLADYNWKIKRVSNNSELKGRELRQLKDIEMAEEADYGFMIWNDVYTNRYGQTSVSSGTLSNIINLLLRNKPVVVFYIPKKSFYELLSINDFEKSLLIHIDEKTKMYYEKNFKFKNNTNQEPPLLVSLKK